MVQRLGPREHHVVEESPYAALSTSHAHVAHGEVKTQLGAALRGLVLVDLGINEVFQEFFHSQAQRKQLRRLDFRPPRCITASSAA